jgi:hypothetical protein
MPTIEAALLRPGDDWSGAAYRRPSADEVARAARRIARCARGAEYAAADSRGLGGLAP